MRRQVEGWDNGERELERRGMRLLKKWTNVAHAVDVGNEIKRHYREELSLYAKDNYIKVSETAEDLFNDEDVEEIVTSIVEQENDAHKLASEIEENLIHYEQASRMSYLTSGYFPDHTYLSSASD